MVNSPYTLPELHDKYAQWKNNISSNFSLDEQLDQASKNLKAVWANIELALIKSKFHNSKESSDSLIKKIKSENKYLNEADL